MNKKNATFTAQAAVIAALYAVMTYCLQPLSFSGGQLRISEALTILPVITPAAVPALAVGCFISNLASPFGVLDLFLGTSATLIAAVLSRLTAHIRFKNLPILSAIFPVVLNSVSAGFIIAFMNGGGFTFAAFTASALSVAAGESIVCFLFGIPLCRVLEKSKIFTGGNRI